MVKLYIDDFNDKKTWISICRLFGVFLDNNLKCSKTGYEIQEIKFNFKNLIKC